MVKAMKNKNANSYCPVQLELELEIVASLWPPLRRLKAAKKFRRWARQLEVSAHVMINRSSGSNRKPFLPRIARRLAALN